MKPLDDGLLTARPVDPRDDDGDAVGDGGVAGAIAVRAPHATGPPSPPRDGTGRPKTRSAGGRAEDAPRADGAVRRLLAIPFLLIAAGLVVERWCHHHHGSYLPRWMGSGQGLPMESMDAVLAGKVVNETAESTAAEVFASPSASPTWAFAASSPEAAPVSPSALDAGSCLPHQVGITWGLPSMESMDAESTRKVVDETAESTAAEASASDAGAEAEAALERKLAALENQTAKDESPRRKAALLEELLPRRERAAEESVMAGILRRLRGLGPAGFAVGDVVEQLYNANTLKSRVLYPFRVEEVHYGTTPAEIRYTMTKLSDGTVVERVPESFLRPYVPYGPGTRALCNVGGATKVEERLFPCSVLEHVRQDGKGTSSSAYRVALRGGAAEGGEVVLPMGRVQRRPN